MKVMQKVIINQEKIYTYLQINSPSILFSEIIINVIVITIAANLCLITCLLIYFEPW